MSPRSSFATYSASRSRSVVHGDDDDDGTLDHLKLIQQQSLIWELLLVVSLLPICWVALNLRCHLDTLLNSHLTREGFIFEMQSFVEDNLSRGAIGGFFFILLDVKRGLLGIWNQCHLEL
jgi:hypothetical protein